MLNKITNISDCIFECAIIFVHLNLLYSLKNKYYDMARKLLEIDILFLPRLIAKSKVLLISTRKQFIDMQKNNFGPQICLYFRNSYEGVLQYYISICHICSMNALMHFSILRKDLKTYSLKTCNRSITAIAKFRFETISLLSKLTVLSSCYFSSKGKALKPSMVTDLQIV